MDYSESYEAFQILSSSLGFLSSIYVVYKLVRTYSKSSCRKSGCLISCSKALAPPSAQGGAKATSKALAPTSGEPSPPENIVVSTTEAMLESASDEIFAIKPSESLTETKIILNKLEEITSVLLELIKKNEAKP